MVAKTLKERLIEQKLDRLNRESKEIEERQRPMPGYHPFGKNKDKGLVGRFDNTTSTMKHDLSGEVGYEYKKDDESAPASSHRSSIINSVNNIMNPQNNTLTKFNHLDKHEKITYGLLQQDEAGREVLHAAEERVGVNLEKIR